MATYQLRQREYLLHITRAMTSRLDLPSLLDLILRSAAETVGCRAGLILLDRHGVAPLVSGAPNGPRSALELPRFQVHAAHGIPDELLPAFNPLLDFMPLANQSDEFEAEYDYPSGVMNQPHMTPQAKLQQRLRLVEDNLGGPLGQVVGLPLLFEDDLLGVIYLFRGEHAFTPLDTQFLEGFAYQAAIAVRNARLYQQLETERSRLATLIENSADGIMILDVNRRVLIMNQALATMVDMSPEEAVGLPCSAILTLENVQGDDLCSAEGYLGLLHKEGLRCEGDLVRPGGAYITVAVTYTPLYNEERRLVNIIANIYDITRFREEEEMKSTFTTIISHELKTPVALIKGYAQTLARPDAAWDAETARQSLQIIEEEADRLEALINNLLDVSKIQAGGLRLDISDVNIKNLAQNVADVYRIQTKKHSIELDFPPHFPTVWGDEERLRQVLTNLVNNAIKYSPDGGAIRIGGWEENEPHNPKRQRLVVYVADQGIGIPQDELAHIFERFYRVDSSLRRSTAGAGIGLFLCKSIVEAHGGEIWARAESGKGTTFFFALPLEQSYRETK
ncbi:MAG: ATP-binding protein [Caldilineaceae bacterium]